MTHLLSAFNVSHMMYDVSHFITSFTLPLTGVVQTVAGTGSSGFSGDGGSATSAQIGMEFRVNVDASGNIYIADTDNRRIRMVTKSTGKITTVAGDGSYGYSGDDGPATSAAMISPNVVAVDSSGNIFISDTGNYVIRMVTKSTGVITTVAGTGESGYSGDGGLATSAKLSTVEGIAVDASGNIYISDTDNDRVRMVTMSTGIITTVAGGGYYGFDVNGQLATSATVGNPRGLAIDASGNLYIATRYQEAIRMVTKSTGTISTVAGSGTSGFSGDGGLATSAKLKYVDGVAVDASGNIYIADGGNSRIRKVTKSTGIVTTLAGDGASGYKGDGGPGSLARLNSPDGVAVDVLGNVYIADTRNYRVRSVSMSDGASPVSSPVASPSVPSPVASPVVTRSPTPSPSPAPTVFLGKLV